MKKIADFIVEKHKLIMILFIILTAAAAFCSQAVEINSDLTKYLPEDSDVKIGMNIMEEEFGQTLNNTTAFRVMFSGLSDEEKKNMPDKLKNIGYIENVTYEPESEEYNKGEYTKYELTVSGVYGSEEEIFVEKALENDFSEYDSIYMVDDMAARKFPENSLLLAFGILMVILLIMSSSWFEPVLFVITIGMAIILNLGTNLIFGAVSDTTSSISPILQLVLSMDYSIILINRYHQELETTDNRKNAMKTAWVQAFGSISGSSLTTIVGLLALVFMSFRLGRDIGTVLAKGVFISVVCVMTFLPGITLICTPLIQKTRKKVPLIPTDLMAKFSYKFRMAITPVFILLFVGVYFLQQNTQLTYVIDSTDEIAKIFPKSQTAVILYENSDEDKVTALSEELENNEDVISVTGYGTLTGKKYTSNEMYDVINNLAVYGSNTENPLDENVLDMLYYSYFSGGEIRPVTVSGFIDFLADDVVNQDTFSGQIDESLKENINNLRKFTNADTLKKPLSIGELAEFTDIEEETCKQLFLLYYIENGGVETGEMTVAQLMDFIVNDVAKDEKYSDFFDKERLETVNNLMKYTDSANMTSPKNYHETAELSGIDETTLKMLYVQYFSDSSEYTPDSMTIPELTAFIKNDVLTNETFSSRFDDSIYSNIDTLSTFTDKNIFTGQMNSSQLAELFGIDESLIKNIFLSDTSGLSDKTMSADEFIRFILENILTDEQYSSAIDDTSKEQLRTAYQIITAAKSGQKYTSSQTASLVGVEEEIINQVFEVYFTIYPNSEQTMTIQQFSNFVSEKILTNRRLSSAVDAETSDTIKKLNTLINSSLDGTQYDIKGLSSLTDIDEQTVTTIFALYFYNPDKTMSPQQFVKYILENVLTNPSYSSSIETSAVSRLELLNTIMDSTDNGTLYDYRNSASLFGIEEQTMKMLYTYKSSENADRKISVQTLLNYIIYNKSVFAQTIGQEKMKDIETLNTVVNSCVQGTKYSSRQMAELIGIEYDTLNNLYLLNISKNGDTAEWKMSVQKFVLFLSENALNNKEIADSLDGETVNKIQNIKNIINAVISESKYSPKELYGLIGGFSKETDEKKLELIFLYHDSRIYSDSEWKLTVEQLINYIVDDLFKDTKFEPFFNEGIKSSLTNTRNTLNDAIKSLKAEHYSRVLIRAKNLNIMENINNFYDNISAKMNNGEHGSYYFIGDSAMSYEMSKTFGSELIFITLLTAVSIFIVVAFTFKNLALPTILVLIVQCGIYIAVSVIGIQGNSLYYLALLMVECILMGSTIDYGILFSSYYRNSRNKKDILGSLKEAYKGSIQTIMTSGSILVIVTGVLSGYFPDPSVAQICSNISVGAFSASMLILFILPGVLASADKLVN